MPAAMLTSAQLWTCSCSSDRKSCPRQPAQAALVKSSKHQNEGSGSVCNCDQLRHLPSAWPWPLLQRPPSWLYQLVLEPSCSWCTTCPPTSELARRWCADTRAATSTAPRRGNQQSENVSNKLTLSMRRCGGQNASVGVSNCDLVPVELHLPFCSMKASFTLHKQLREVGWSLQSFVSQLISSIKARVSIQLYA